MKCIKSLIILAAIIISTDLAKGQNSDQKHALTGIILDSTTNKPIEGAIVSIQDSLNKSVLTNSNGNFSVEFILKKTAPLIVTLKITTFNYKKREVQFPITAKSVNVGKIFLSEDVITLKGVIIESPVVKMDVEKLTYNINPKDYSPNTKLIDVLRNVPLLSVDNDGNIKIQGRIKPRIFLEGKEIDKEQLKSLTHEMISKIEVVSNPTAKYAGDVEGVINIIVKKTKINLIKGSISSGVGFINPFYSGSGSLIYKKNKWLVLLSASALKNHQKTEVEINRHSSALELNQSSSSNFKPLQSSGNATAFYDIDSTRSLNFLLSYNLINENRKESGNIDYSLDNSLGNFTTFANRDRLMLLANVGIEYKKSYKKKSTLVFSGRFGSKKMDRKIAFDNLNNMDNIKTRDRNEDSSLYLEEALNINYASDFLKSKKGRLETGMTMAFRETNGDYTYYDYDSVKNKFTRKINSPQSFKFNQTVIANYLSLRFPVKKFTLQLGVRDEITINKITLIDSNFNIQSSNFNLIPSASLITRLKNNASLRFNYNRRITRPSWTFLNPFSYTENGIETNTGNPNLVPEIRNRYELSYSKNLQKNTFLFSSIYYSATKNAIYRVTRQVLDSTVFQKIFENIGIEQSLGTSLSLTTTLGKKIRFNSNLYAEYYRISTPESSFLINKNDAFLFGGSISLNGKVFKSYFVSFYSSYDNLNVDLQSKTYLNPLTDISIQRNFFKDKLSITARYQDILNNSVNRRTEYFDGLYQQRTMIRNHINNFILTVKYNFGKNFNSNKRRAGIPLNDVKSDPD